MAPDMSADAGPQPADMRDAYATRAGQRDQSSRGILDLLDRRGELLIVADELDPVFELSAVLSLVDHKAAVRFDNVRGHDLPVFGNILTSLERISLVLGVPREQILAHLLKSIAAPIAPRIVTEAVVQEVDIEGGALAKLPVPTFFEKETGPYVTAALIVARDPETGLGNASYARIKILGPDEAMVGIAPNHHLAIMARKAGANGEPLPFAVVIGPHPAIQLAACLYLGLGDDEIHCAGALLGEPVRVVKCKTSDIMVPAEAEIILEGRLYAHEPPIVEGLVSEYHGLYEDYGVGMRATFERMTRRKDAMMQVIEPGRHREHLLMGAVPIAASLKAVLGRFMHNIGDVAITLAGSGRNGVVVQVSDPKPGHARRIMSMCWGAINIIKSVTVVDMDIDPWDLEAVEYARMSRMRFDRDIVIIPDMPADRSEPQEDSGLVSKIGFDATRKQGDRKEGFDKAQPPRTSQDRMRDLLNRIAPEMIP